MTRRAVAPRRALSAGAVAFVVAAGCVSPTAGADADAIYAAEVLAFEPGEGAGFGADRMPAVVLGPPRGRGDAAGSTDVVSLGVLGSITLRLGAPAADGAGADLVVCENAFHVGGDPSQLFVEPARVSVSADGVTFTPFPCEPLVAPYEGCAGLRPVQANGDDAPLELGSPETLGGDAFDLAELGLEEIEFVRIEDGGLDAGPPGTSRGFDLDAVVVLHPAR